MSSSASPQDLRSAVDPGEAGSPILLSPHVDSGRWRQPIDPPLRWREPAVLLLLVTLSDLTIYRGAGFAGYAALFVGSPLLLVLGMARQRADITAWLIGPMLVLLAVRLVWCGSGLTLAVGVVVLACFAAGLAGQRPYIPQALVFALQAIASGYRGFVVYGRSIPGLSAPARRTSWLAFALPIAAFLLFSVLFIMANPDLVKTLSDGLTRLVEHVSRWLADFSPQPTEMLFCAAAAWVSAGLLRPLLDRGPTGDASGRVRFVTRAAAAETSAPLYAAFRNMLVAVIVLFAGYLVFEFKTLWFRVFEKGFYYSGYAHEGAAWLTVALALATAILSAIFRGRILDDARLPRLRKLAWCWSLENMLLAIAVYHRLFIYIGFNGMTRMRIVGLYGMSAVVVGFLLVLWKIARDRDFVWLMRRHLWTVALAVYLYSITPVDVFAMRYNVTRILAGDPAPSVQISVHPISSEGYLVLQPLLDCADPVIREGLRALLAKRLDEAEQQAARRRQDGWTAHQVAEEQLLTQLRAMRGRIAEYGDQTKREAALTDFHSYAYQWF